MQIINCLKPNKFKVVINNNEASLYINDTDLQQQFEQIAQHEFETNYTNFEEFIENLKRIICLND